MSALANSDDFGFPQFFQKIKVGQITFRANVIYDVNFISLPILSQNADYLQASNRRFIFGENGHRNYTLISTSTPLGKSNFIKASTVFVVEV
jgi:hypothetical protein